ncbi:MULTISPECIES: cation:proton antiporter subunit C [Methanocalculus]|uniref:cation:proton antiporter subunit C n=1 Tax=Methanocalculus TaxID=71151 RepID=UPI00209F2954|nr:cation:proton antiporter subunit C [Methanocalculus sp. AMF5]MCP1661883.1 multicomponent Na+:H+ antiporter subunit C [Methanocalculus sp. AMF5]
MNYLDPGFILGHYNYWVSIVLIMIGLYAMIAKRNLIKKFIGLNIIETAIFLFYISLGDVEGGVAPIFPKDAIDLSQETILYANPLPSAMMLTAIVVTLCMTALALSFAVLIYRQYGTLDARRLMEEL